jgi:hypothetical protein
MTHRLWQLLPLRLDWGEVSNPDFEFQHFSVSAFSLSVMAQKNSVLARRFRTNNLRQMKFPVLALSCLLFVSCASDEVPRAGNLTGPFRGGYLSRIAVGMPKAEVIRQIGEPFSVDARNSIELFTYRDAQNGLGQFDDYFVRLIDGKVESFGRLDMDKPAAPNKPVKLTP